jgi:type II secretory pathway component PulK
MRRFKKRRGIALIAVLACSAVAVSLVLLSVEVSLRQRRQLRNELQLEQTRWVLDAAIRKSIANDAQQTADSEVKPKLERFDKVSFSIDSGQPGGQVFVHAKIENFAGTKVTTRSASFKASD